MDWLATQPSDVYASAFYQHLSVKLSVKQTFSPDLCKPVLIFYPITPIIQQHPLPDSDIFHLVPLHPGSFTALGFYTYQAIFHSQTFNYMQFPAEHRSLLFISNQQLRELNNSIALQQNKPFFDPFLTCNFSVFVNEVEVSSRAENVLRENADNFIKELKAQDIPWIAFQ
ncbi:Hypothetical_protein [Hexamita inflata]|uniref:Hypothetical_protein n=1 Tax=Hexamita inflata TaxID=28002 RepID=A0AA86UWX6_9EUKA|nr:Hypothetical protein HINF_LOCUS55637 [Hexamita inflata]